MQVLKLMRTTVWSKMLISCFQFSLRAKVWLKSLTSGFRSTFIALEWRSRPRRSSILWPTSGPCQSLYRKVDPRPELSLFEAENPTRWNLQVIGVPDCHFVRHKVEIFKLTRTERKWMKSRHFDEKTKHFEHRGAQFEEAVMCANILLTRDTFFSAKETFETVFFLHLLNHLFFWIDVFRLTSRKEYFAHDIWIKNDMFTL